MTSRTLASIQRRRGRGSRTRRLWRWSTKVVGEVLRWVVLIEFVYIFLFPVLFMVATSFKTPQELNNPATRWIPDAGSVEGYQLVLAYLGYWRGLVISIWTSVLAALGQTLVGALIAYGFARLRFPGRDLLFGVLLFSIVVPPQTLVIPQMMLYTRLKWIDTYLPMLLPSYLGLGIRGAILLIVYRQFFRGMPYELEDAGYVDGAGPFRTFAQIMLPLAKPAILVISLFSLVWTWNDTYIPWLYIRSRELWTLPQRMMTLGALLAGRDVTLQDQWRENTWMAAVVLTVAPMLILYVFTQRYFTESIDRTGLVE